MSFSVNTNTSALAALQTLNMTSRNLQETQAHINSGYKVAGAKDNASTFAIAQGMRGDIAGLKSVQESLSLGQSTVNVALSAAQQISDKLNQMKDKVVQGQSANVDQAKIQADINSLKQQITDVANAAQFNGVNLLTSNTVAKMAVTSSLNRTASSGAGSVTVATINVDSVDVTATGLAVNGVSITGNNSFKVTSDNTAAIAAGKILKFTVGGVEQDFEFTTGAALTSVTDATHTAHAVLIVATDSTQAALGKMYTAIRAAGFTVTNNEDGSFVITAPSVISGQAFNATGFTPLAPGPNPAAQIDTIEVAVDTANKALAALGVASNRLQTQGDFVKSLTDTLTTGVSTLVDADLAAESASLQALQTKQQLGIQALSIANQQSSAVLSLFK